MTTANKPIIFFDLETTGTKITQDRILQIAAVKVTIIDGVFHKEETKKILINPGIPIPKEASDVHGILDEDVKDKPMFSSYAKSLLDYFEGCDIGGFNSIRFDLPLLMAEFERYGFSLNLEDTNLIDAYTIFSKKQERTLSAAYMFYCGKELEGAHDAENDILATVEVFEAQLKSYDDLEGMDIHQLHDFCGGDTRVDLAGHLAYNANREVIFNFGKHKGSKVLDEVSYAQWMLGSDFPIETRRIIKELITR